MARRTAPRKRIPGRKSSRRLAPRLLEPLEPRCVMTGFWGAELASSFGLDWNSLSPEIQTLATTYVESAEQGLPFAIPENWQELVPEILTALPSDLNLDNLNLDDVDLSDWNLDDITGEILAYSTGQHSAGNTFSSFASAEELDQYLLNQAVAQWQGQFGQPAWGWWHDYARAWDFVPQPAFSVANLLDTTNVQVAGVDEGDIVETDGEYLYILGGDRLSIVDARDPAHLQLVSQTPLDGNRGWGGSLYLNGDRLTFVSQSWDVIPLVADAIDPGFSFRPQPHSGPGVQVVTWDVSTPATPTVVQDLSFDGSLVQSRVIDGKLLLVTNQGLSYPAPEMTCDDAQAEPTDDVVAPALFQLHGSQCVYESEADYIARWSAQSLADVVLPQVTVGSGDDATTSSLLQPGQLYHTDLPAHAVTSAIVVDLLGEQAAPTHALGLMGDWATQIYVSNSNLYVLATTWSESGEQTTIRQFSLTGAEPLSLVAQGTVPGHVLNQFSIDEHNGTLRIATTQSIQSPPDEHGLWQPPLMQNGVYVLQQDGESLTTIGSLEGIAPGESIFAALFLGDRAFLVTFRRIDPLFAIDLSDPTHPTIAGEIELPGFSNYLHPITDNLLLGVGRENGNDAKLSLFDVSNLELPTLASDFVIDALGWLDSAAFFDHHAVSYFPDEQILAVPFNRSRWEWVTTLPWVTEGIQAIGLDPNTIREAIEQAPANGLWVFQIDTANQSIDLLGTVGHDSPVQRSVRIGDTLFSIAESSVKAVELTNPTHLLGELFTGPLGAGDHFEVPIGGETRTLDVLANDGPFHTGFDGTIASVSATDASGTVAIAADGRSLLYTPPASFEDAGRFFDSFTYTIRDAQGIEAVVHVGVRLTFDDHRSTMVELAKEDLAERTGAAVADIRVDYSYPTQWPDACLGVPSESECASVVTPGHVIQLSTGQHAYVYHTDTIATVRLAFDFDRYNDPGTGDGNSAGPVDDQFGVRPDSTDNRFDVLANDFPGVRFVTAPKVTAVSDGSAGGTISIVDHGFAVSYTPVAGFTGKETFSYTVDGGDTATVTVTVRDALVDIRLQPTDLDGNPIVSVVAGEEFLLKLFVDDLRNDAQGVYATFTDVLYPADLVNVISARSSSDFTVGRTGTVSAAGIVDELGGASSALEPTGGDERLLAQVRLRAQDAGTATFTADPADNLPISDVLLFGVNTPIPQGLVNYGSATLEVLDGWTNVENPFDCNDDGLATVSDALLMIGSLNEIGAHALKYETPELRAQATFINADTRQPQRLMFDTNDDGYFSPIDILLVINHLIEQAANRGSLAGSQPQPVSEPQAEPDDSVMAPSVRAADVELSGFVATPSSSLPKSTFFVGRLSPVIPVPPPAFASPGPAGFDRTDLATHFVAQSGVDEAFDQWGADADWLSDL